jgi:hypothetical protein
MTAERFGMAIRLGDIGFGGDSLKYIPKNIGILVKTLKPINKCRIFIYIHYIMCKVYIRNSQH